MYLSTLKLWNFRLFKVGEYAPEYVGGGGYACIEYQFALRRIFSAYNEKIPADPHFMRLFF